MNHLNRIIQTSIAAALLILAAPSAVRADPQSPPSSITFETVDSVQAISKQRIAVKGIPTGQTQAQEYYFYFYGSQVDASECLKQAVIAMDRPGRYQLAFDHNGDDSFACRLTRR